MKMTILFLLACSIQLSAKVHSQTITYRARNATLKEVFAAIKAQTGYVVFYDNDDISHVGAIKNIAANNQNLSDFLQNLFKDLPFSFTVEKKNILVTRKSDNPVIHIQNAFTSVPPMHDLRVHVTDTTGRSLAGASVMIKGTNKGGITNVNGDVTISTVKDNDILIISFTGYKTKEIEVNHTDFLDVTLSYSVNSLNDVVTIGYGTTNKKDLTGSVVNVTSEDFTPGPIVSPENLIAGKVAGLSIAPGSGQPGSAASIYIRGISSLNANQRPLIVIDGIPLDQDGITGSTNTLALINPNDIASFTILKDASAAAIYGSRASGGVILITTKKGSAGGRLEVTFNTNNSISVVSKTIPVLSARQFRHIVDSLGSDEQKAYLGTANTDWSDEVFHQALGTDNNISLSGGIKNLPYRLSLGYTDQNGTVKTGFYKRYSTALSLTPSFFTHHLNITLNAMGSFERDRVANATTAINAATYYDPTQPVYSSSSPFGGYFEYIDSTTGYVNSKNPINPLDYLQADNRMKANKLTGNLMFDYRFHFLPDLRANLNMAMENTNGYYSYFSPLTEAAVAQTGGSIGASRETKRNKTIEFYLDYAKEFKNIKSNIDLTAGYGYYDFKYGIPQYDDMNLLGDTTNVNIADSAQNTLISYYGRLQYKYNNRFFLTATIRTDGSSRFAPNNRWGTFPSIALAYQLLSKQKAVVNNLKLRIGYGITGQQDIGSNYAYIPAYTESPSNVAYAFGGQYIPTVTPNGYNTSLKWENTATANFGIDYSLFDNLLTGSLDIYQKKTNNMLVNANLPAGANLVNSIYQNIGSMRNRGIEFALNGTPVKSNNFSWTFNFNLSYNVNKVTKLTQYPDSSFPGYTVNAVQVIKVVYPAYSFFTYKQLYDQNGKPVEGSYKDFDNNGIINTADQYVGKSPLPKYIVGFSSNFQYKRLSFSFVARANLGNYVYNDNAATEGHYSWMFNTFLAPVNAPAGILKSQFNSLQTYSDYYVKNASFLKIDNISASYDLGKVFHGVKDLGVSFVVQNPFVFNGYDGVDPEISGGYDSNFYSRSRIYSIGLKAQF